MSDCNIAHQLLLARAAGVRGVGLWWWGACNVLPCDWSMWLLRHVAAPGAWSMGSIDEHFLFSGHQSMLSCSNSFPKMKFSMTTQCS